MLMDYVLPVGSIFDFVGRADLEHVEQPTR